MSVLKNIHHINFVVADLKAAVGEYGRLLGLDDFEYETLPGRDVETARVNIGGVWIVLVSPQNDNSVVGRYLKAHGEGFFLLSFGVDDLDDALEELTRRGAVARDRQVRTGLDDWQVADLQTEEHLSVRFHLTESR